MYGIYRYIDNPVVLGLCSLFWLFMLVDAIRNADWAWVAWMVFLPFSAIYYYMQIYRGAGSTVQGFELPGASSRRRIKELQRQIHNLDKAHYHLELGDIYFQKGKLLKAEQSYRDALARDPKDIDTRAHLGQCLLRLIRPNDAAPLLHDVCSENPKHDYGYSLMAYAETLTALGHVDNAIIVWKQVLADHGYARAKVQLGELYIQKQQGNLAKVEFREVINDDPHAPGYQRRRDRVWVRKAKRLIKSVAVVALLLCGPLAHGTTVLVFAASSLTDGLKEIARDYSGKSSDKIEFNFAASSVLARQIQEGATADIFFSADDFQMDDLERANLTDKTTRRERLSNSLVIVTPSDDAQSITTPQDLASAKVKHLALADPRAVPAGVYAKRYLVQAGLWEKVSRKIVPMPNVRAALSIVEAGNAEAGIVYKTDAGISKRVRVAYSIPIAEGPAIHYPVALVKAGKEAKAAQAFLDYLNSEAAGKVFEKFGFIIDKATP